MIEDMQNPNKKTFPRGPLSLGNQAFREGNFTAAASLYRTAKETMPSLKHIIEANLALIEKRSNLDQPDFNTAIESSELGQIQSFSTVVSEPNQVKSSAVNPAIPIIEFDATQEVYVPYQVQTQIVPCVKLIANYLPQFHPFPENDGWWGKGFTEWSNVGRAVPNYKGHYQPHCPIHFGYYDLRIPQVMEDQAALAKEYGISGFNYYFYWFDGKILMETPLLAMLENENIDMPFCLTWANENWTRRWDGQDQDILIGQNHSITDSLAFITHLIKYFNDSRYIRIDGKPVLIIYRANIIPDIQQIAQEWRNEILRHGFSGLYLISAQTFGIKSPEPFGFDASMEFPPHTVSSTDIRHELNLVAKRFDGYIFSYNQVVENAVQYKEPPYKVFRSAMLSWDNTARKQDSSHIFHGFTLLKYKQWLNSLCCHVFNSKKYAHDEKIVFVNAWNEWAEGTHLEPDRKYGFGYLKSTREVIEKWDASVVSAIETNSLIKSADVAVILHLHYGELWSEIKCALENFGNIPFDLYVTITDTSTVSKIRRDFPQAYIRIAENRGRDVLPFISILRDIHGFDYKAICKIHSKKSTYRPDGNGLRTLLIDRLLTSEASIDDIVMRFNQDERLGLVVPAHALIKHNSHNMTFDAVLVAELAEVMNIEFSHDVFPAGSMFWFRQSALSRLLLLDESHFELERGLADGTVPHAVERLFCTAAKSIGYCVLVI